MVINSAVGISTTRSWAWVDTFLVKTCLIWCTFWANCAFRSATRWITYVSRCTRAHRLTINGPTNTIWSTGWWSASFWRFWSWSRLKRLMNRETFSENEIESVLLMQLPLSIGARLQYLNGSPVKPFMQVHDGKWFTTWHSVLSPQVPGQGSLHLFRMQARLAVQSELTTHSGRHPS